MAEVATRTSRSGSVGDAVKNASGNFDVRSWQGLTSILKAGRESGMDAEAYADFRDTVLRYAQSGGTDPTLRKKIEAVMQTLTLSEPVPVSASAVSEKGDVVLRDGKNEPMPISTGGVLGGRARVTPQFSVAPPETNKFVPVKVSKREASVPDNLPTKEVEMTPVNKTEVVTPDPLQTKGEVVNNESIRKVPPPLKTVDEYKARIALIKRTVNAQVGNPVVLMDGENTIGRTYMTALLSAMKAVSGTAPGTLQSSMDALEAAFARISELPDAAKQETEVVTGAPVAPIEIEKEIPIEEPIAIPAPEVPIQEPAPAPIPAPKPVVAPVPAIVTESPLPPSTKEALPTPEPLIPQVEEKGEVPVLVKDVPTSRPTLSRIPPRVPEVKAVPPRPPLRASSAPLIPSVVTREKETSIVSSQTESTSPAIKDGGKHTTKGVGRSGFDVTIEGDVDYPVPEAIKDDLHTPEIDAGLTQLLHDWSIFRSGGLFGTGPGGVNHPLYGKLAPLPMSIVATGSWENAHKEAILSVRDYINGWRHEQGVVYAPTESFEHYLRRVIRQILKRGSVK